MNNLVLLVTVCVLLSGPFGLYATPDEDLIAAADSGDLSKAKIALKAGANPNAKGFAETPPLISAAINGHAEIVKLLIGAKADIHAKNLARMSALDYALMHKQTEVIKILEKAGARANTVATKPQEAVRPSGATKNQEAGNPYAAWIAEFT